MSISDFLKEKAKEKNIINLKEFRKPKKFVKFKNKVCEYCGKNKFLVVYKMISNDILAYKCDQCGNSIFVKDKSKKVIKKEETISFEKDIIFKCPLGEIDKCVFEICSFYGNICKL